MGLKVEESGWFDLQLFLTFHSGEDVDCWEIGSGLTRQACAGREGGGMLEIMVPNLARMSGRMHKVFGKITCKITTSMKTLLVKKTSLNFYASVAIAMATPCICCRVGQ